LSVDKSVQSLGYQPYIIDPSTYAEISASEIAAKGYSFRDSEQGIDDHYQTEPCKNSGQKKLQWQKLVK
jgi:hypothetical protein